MIFNKNDSSLILKKSANIYLDSINDSDVILSVTLPENQSPATKRVEEEIKHIPQLIN